jgi:hypothetical protein
MKKLAVATFAALSMGALYAADPQPDATPQAPPPPPAPEAAPKPLPPLDNGQPERPHGRKPDWKANGQKPDWKMDRRKGGPLPPGEARQQMQRERMHQRPGFNRGPGGPEGKDKPKAGHGEMLTQALNLTPEQQKKAREIMQATRPKLQAAREESMAKEKQILSDAMQELRPSLTPEQQAVFDDLQKLRADREALKKTSAPAKPEKADKKKKDDA